MSQNDGRIKRYETIVAAATAKFTGEVNAGAGDRRGASKLISRKIKKTSRGGSGRCVSDRTQLDIE